MQIALEIDLKLYMGNYSASPKSGLLDKYSRRWGNLVAGVVTSLAIIFVVLLCVDVVAYPVFELPLSDVSMKPKWTR